MHYGKNNINYIYHLNGVILEDVHSHKDLGVVIDDELSYHEQIMKCIQKAVAKLYMIKRSFTFMDEDTFLNLYRVFVRPILEYCQTIWSPHLQYHINAIENVQRRATKLVPSVKDLPYEERLEHLKLYKLSDRRCRGDMIYVFKMLKYMVNIDYNNYFNISENPHNTRGHHMKISLGKNPTINTRRNYFTNRIVVPWNSLPAEVVESNNLNEFKKKYDEHREEIKRRI